MVNDNGVNKKLCKQKHKFGLLPFVITLPLLKDRPPNRGNWGFCLLAREKRYFPTMRTREEGVTQGRNSKWQIKAQPMVRTQKTCKKTCKKRAKNVRKTCKHLSAQLGQRIG
ncbi:hypothetical protein POVWA2_052910 [Plasmodium ovale wallikeri]|uniref:Uncharacterized protein n=1 Tax=Plasmodium ovale wallikeri TaxID=864142 RepID=A0A1A8ZSN8_PLAOA|nr:hypothetical protein POVWA1_053640 [Plasmodium ovale wallikeri]SBT46895.1 hypothetical protein POVWA2_052910 [Plasmodium ovale wallikeri]